MSNERTHLFVKYNLRDLFDRKKQEIIDEINGFEPDYVANVTIEASITYFQEKHRLQVPTIKEAEITTEVREATKPLDNAYDRDVLLFGSEFLFYVPFEGEGDLFLFRPSSYFQTTSECIIEPGELILLYFTQYGGHEGADREAGQIRVTFDSDLAKIKKYLSSMASDVAQFEKSISDIVAPQVEYRQKKYLKERKMGDSLGYPLRRRENAPTPITRKTLPVSRPAVTKKSSEPFLGMSEYENILSVISDMTAVIERSPKAFATLPEEDLRWHFLVQLNSQYKESATGETFNFEGKTDILIRVDGKNIFIAECKFWHGPQGLLDTLDQLLGYVSWRDTKTAILLFNRNRNLSTVLAKVPEAVKTHLNYKRDLQFASETGFRYVFSHRDDKDRELILTILVFEVPN